MSDEQDNGTSASRMQLLLVDESEEDALRLQELLERMSEARIGMDHATSLEEALIRMSEKTYDLVMCEHAPEHSLALRLVHETRQDSPARPMIFLTQRADQATHAEAIAAGAYDCVQLSALDGDSLARTIRYALDLYGRDRQREKAEDMLRKLWRAVEQSADLVLITDRSGVIEYVNPAFEALTGYDKQEVVGRTPRILKSGQHSLRFYREMWNEILAGVVFRGVMENRKKNGEVFYAEKTITPLRDAEGQITHFISNDRDITGRRTLELQLQQAQKMDAIGRLAGGANPGSSFGEGPAAAQGG